MISLRLQQENKVTSLISGDIRDFMYKINENSISVYQKGICLGNIVETLGVEAEEFADYLTKNKDKLVK